MKTLKLLLLTTAFLVPLAWAGLRQMPVGYLDFENADDVIATKSGRTMCQRKTDGFLWCKDDTAVSTMMPKVSAAGSAGQVLQSAGAGLAQAWSTPTYPSASGSAGKLLRSDGTNNAYSTFTFPDTATQYDLIYASAANTWSSLAKTNSAILKTDSSGVPAWIAYAAGFDLLSGLTAVGEMIYGGTAGARAILAANTAATMKLLTETGTGSAGQAPAWTTPSAFLDAAFTSTQGSLLYRGAATWAALAPGVSGQFLKTLGSGANPLWATASGTATFAGAKAITNSTTSLTGNTWTDLALTTEVYDPNNIMSSSQITCDQTGKWHASGGAVLSASMTATDQHGIRLVANNVVQCETEFSATSTATYREGLTVNCDMICNAGEVLKVQVRAQGTSGHTVVSSTYGNFFDAHYIGN